jgi:alpha-tubulin suppressor-like RCC1 family protein
MDGQLHDGFSTPAQQPPNYCYSQRCQANDGAYPAQLSGLSIQQVSTGDQQTCALTTTGDVWCWGRNDTLETGAADGGALQLTPAQVAISGASKISCGYQHCCAIKSDATAWCWGAGDIHPYNYSSWGNSEEAGLRGDGDATIQSTPTQVLLSATALDDGGVQQTPLTGVTDLAAGEQHSCAVAGGKVYCFGDNARGEIGDGSPASLPDGGVGFAPFASQVSGLTNVTQVSVNHMFSCALKSDGTIWCWGRNTRGQLGNLTTQDSNVPVQVMSCE